MYFVYIVKSFNGRYYVGSALDIEKRLKKHNSGGSVWTRRYKPWKLVYSESYNLKHEALKREKEIKSYKGGNEFKKLIKD